MSAPDLAPIRLWARNCAADPYTSNEWRADYESLAEACERLMRRIEHSTLRPGEGSE